MLRKWFLVAAADRRAAAVGVVVVASVIKPDIGFNYVPTHGRRARARHVLAIVGRNSLVLALHAFACIAGFIAGVSLPLSAESKKGISRWVHDRARPVAFAWVVIVTCFSLVTQTAAAGDLSARPSPRASRSRPAR